MDKKSIIGLILIFGIFVGYMAWVSPSAEEREKMRVEDSIRKAQVAEEQRVKDSVAHAAATDSASLAADSTAADSMAIAGIADMGIFQSLVSTEGQIMTVGTERMTVELNTLGAMINKVMLKDYQTYNKQPLELITPGADNLNYIFSVADRTVQTQHLLFTPYVNNRPWDGTPLNLKAGDSAIVALRAWSSPTPSVVITTRWTSTSILWDLTMWYTSTSVPTWCGKTACCVKRSIARVPAANALTPASTSSLLRTM